jgi:hypothetical protein
VRVIGWRIERVKAVPLRLDVRTVGKRESHSPEDRHRAVEELRDRVERAERCADPGR